LLAKAREFLSMAKVADDVRIKAAGHLDTNVGRFLFNKQTQSVVQHKSLQDIGCCFYEELKGVSTEVAELNPRSGSTPSTPQANLANPSAKKCVRTLNQASISRSTSTRS